MIDSVIDFESATPAARRPAAPADNRLFSRFGVEIEYMVVDRRTLDVRPVVPELMAEVGAAEGDHCDGELTWSNELVSHVLELKLSRPADCLGPVGQCFRDGIPALNARLAERGCILLPTGMHPWMNPTLETRIWPAAGREIYEAYDRIFNCRRHGWANLQSTHLNLPFANDDEFRRLHTAIRVLMPLLPALAASSPFREGKATEWLDTRMEVYRTNSALVPSVTGHLVPERIESRAEYEEKILQRIYADVRELDPEGTLADEWMNARGAIARFDRGTVEIRVLDTQECPAADLAIVQFIVAVLRELVSESLSPYHHQAEATTARLAEEMGKVVREGRAAVITDKLLLRALGIRWSSKATAGRIWADLLARVASAEVAWRAPIETILSKGCLAERILCAAGNAPQREGLRSVYSQLATCLARGEMFLP